MHAYDDAVIRSPAQPVPSCRVSLYPTARASEEVQWCAREREHPYVCITRHMRLRVTYARPPCYASLLCNDAQRPYGIDVRLMRRIGTVAWRGRRGLGLWVHAACGAAKRPDDATETRTGHLRRSHAAEHSALFTDALRGILRT